MLSKKITLRQCSGLGRHKDPKENCFWYRVLPDFLVQGSGTGYQLIFWYAGSVSFLATGQLSRTR